MVQSRANKGMTYGPLSNYSLKNVSHYGQTNVYNSLRKNKIYSGYEIFQYV